jgi:hypothetical protein
MRLVSIETFISIVYGEDDHPPSVSTLRRRCPTIPGAFRDGKRWRIDIDIFFSVMRSRAWGGTTEAEDDEDLAVVMKIVKQTG